MGLTSYETIEISIDTYNKNPKLHSNNTKRIQIKAIFAANHNFVEIQRIHRIYKDLGKFRISYVVFHD